MVTSRTLKAATKERQDLERDDSGKKAHRWVVEVAHGWFNRFRKLLARYEKLERSFIAESFGRRYQCFLSSAKNQLLEVF